MRMSATVGEDVAVCEGVGDCDEFGEGVDDWG